MDGIDQKTHRKGISFLCTWELNTLNCSTDLFFHDDQVKNWRIKDDNFGFAVMCCLVIVRRVHIWSSVCRPCGIHYDKIYESPMDDRLWMKYG